MLNLALASALLLLLQNPPPPPVPREAPAPLAQPDAKPLVPGAIPESAGPEERALFQQLCRAALAPNSPRVPLVAFDLLLDAQIRNSTNQVNESVTPLRYRYQQPEWVRATTEHGYELLHGSKGDFLIDPKRNEKRPLAVGREGEEDRKQLAEIRDLARNFLALSDPAALRIAELRMGRVDAALVPDAAKYAWIELVTPDFRLPNQAQAALVRVQLGLDRAKGLPALCLVGPGEPGARPMTLIRIKNYREKQGLEVPHDLALFPLEKTTGKFPEKPPLQIWLKNDSNLRPQFGPETFLP